MPDHALSPHPKIYCPECPPRSTPVSITQYVRNSTRCLGTMVYSASSRHCGRGRDSPRRHYRPDELAETWGLSVKVIREIFSSESGVLKVDRPETRNKRGYCSMRSPSPLWFGSTRSLQGARAKAYSSGKPPISVIARRR